MAEQAGARAPEPRLTNSPQPEPKVEMPVIRSRWIPKREQITLLESIFNSGKVNPSRAETTRIRMMLEEYGKVADASIFYWFQNRRSKYRGRQRLVQASRNASRGGGEQPKAQPEGSGGGGSQGGPSTIDQFEDYLSVGSPSYPPINSPSSSSVLGMDTQSTCSDDLSSFLGPPPVQEYEQNSVQEYEQNSVQEYEQNSVQEYEQNSVLCSSASSPLNYQHGMITVFINEVPTEVVRGPVDIGAMFGGDFLMYHSSGERVQVNEYGTVTQSLHHGESYIVVIINCYSKNPFLHRRKRCTSCKTSGCASLILICKLAAVQVFGV